MTARPRWKKLALAGAAAALGLLVAEGGTRAWRALRGDAYRAGAARRELDEVHAAVAGALPHAAQAGARDEAGEEGAERVLHPYLGFDLARGNKQIDRDLERLARHGEERFAILLTGGSVAGIFGSVGMRRLTELLAGHERFAGRRLVALNYGRAAYKQPQQLLLLGYLLGLGLEPDLVINLDGFNELAVAASNARVGTHPSYPSIGQWGPIATAHDSGPRALELLGQLIARRNALLEAVDRLRNSPLLHSAVFGQLALERVRARERGYVEAQVAYTSRERRATAALVLRGPRPPDDFETLLEVSVRQWLEGSRSLHALCRQRGIDYLHVLQPTLHDEGSKPLTREERKGSTASPEWVKATRTGYPRLRAAGAELSAEGIHFVDATRVFAEVEERLYFDACHFIERGNVLLAEEIARAILASDVGR